MSISLSILQTILLTSAIILVVWLANNALGSRTGYRWRKILWLILALRLLLPVPLNITSLVPQVSRLEVNLPIAPQAPLRFFERFNIGGINSPDVPSPVTGNTPDNISDNTNDNNSSQGINPTQNTDNPAANSFDTGIKAFVFKTFFGSFASLFAAIWAIGFAAIAIMRLIQYSRLKKHLLKESTIDTNETVYRLLKKRAAATMDAVCIEFGIQKPLEIIISESLRSPMLFGYSNTRLLLPKNNYNEKELDSILRHELTHYKNRDLWYKLLMLFTCDLYWFNPLLRLMKTMAYQDVECICDDRATKYMNLEAKRIYCTSILRTMTGAKNSHAFTTQFACGKRAARHRLENILSISNRKLGASILCVLLAILITGTACISLKISSRTGGTAADAGNSETAAEKEDIETEWDSNQPATLKLGIYPTGNDGAGMLALHDSYIEKLTTDNPNITVEKTPYTYSADTFIPLVISGRCPTVFETWYTDTGTLIKGGNVKDITDILNKRGWLDSMAPSYKRLVSDEAGRVYGVPKEGYLLGLMVNADMFEAAGLVDEHGVPLYPKTWNELAEDARLIKEATGQAGFCLLAGDHAAGWHFSNIAWAFGARLAVDNGDGTFTADLDSPEAIAAMEFVKSLKWEYNVLTDDPTIENYESGFKHIANGTAAMYIAANDAVSMPAQKGLAPDRYGLGPMPAGPGGEYCLTGNSTFVFSKESTAADVNAALDYLTLMGCSPVVTDAVKQSILDNARADNELGIPVIKSFTVWNAPELKAAYSDAINQYGNVDEAFYASYFDFAENGSLRPEIGFHPTELYAELAIVLQEVLTNRDADVARLMKTADENYQAGIPLWWDRLNIKY
ncbi:MAG: extracellular solute-binding protein [Lachnospiraceae bacterium]|nr:extracellular solute-binding protein [Lachnospiraceae bacterium]